MMKTSRLRFQKGDFLAIMLVAVLGLVIFLCFFPSSKEAGSLEIYQNGVLIRSVPLNEDQQFTITGDYTNTVTIRSGAAAITHSNCPGEDCVSSGWMEHSGRSIVCLPNAVELRLVGTEADVDFVVG